MRGIFHSSPAAHLTLGDSRWHGKDLSAGVSAAPAWPYKQPCKDCPRHKSRVVWGMVAPGTAGLRCHHPHGDPPTPSHHGAGLGPGYPGAFPFQARGPGWGEPCAGPDLVPRTSLAAMLVLFACVLGTLVTLGRALQALGSALPSRVLWHIGNISETAGLWHALAHAG